MNKIFIFFILILNYSAWATTYTIAVEDDAPPWSYKDGSGYANDLVKIAYKAVGGEVKFEVYPYARCKQLVEDGERIACLTVSETSDTDKKILFPKNNLIDVHNILWVRKKEGIVDCNVSKWPKPLNLITTLGYEYVEQFNELVTVGAIKAINVNSESQALKMLLSKRADTVLVNVDAIKNIDYVLTHSKLKGDVAIGCDLGTLKGYLGFSKKFPDSQKALDLFDKGYYKILNNGDLKKLQQTWIKNSLKF